MRRGQSATACLPCKGSPTCPQGQEVRLRQATSALHGCFCPQLLIMVEFGLRQDSAQGRAFSSSPLTLELAKVSSQQMWPKGLLLADLRYRYGLSPYL